MSGVLETLRATQVIQGRLELTAPWGAHLENVGHASFYVITEGGGWLQLDGSPQPVEAATGSFIFVRRGEGYSIRDRPETPLRPVAQWARSSREGSHELIQGGGGGARTAALFGCFAFDEDHPLSASLPALLHLEPGDHPTVRWIDASLRLMAETRGPRAAAGHGAFMSRLAEALLMQVLRAHLDQNGGANWVDAWIEPPLARVLNLIHERPGEPWTVESLAAAVGMSRTAFATRFVERLGEPPLQYLTRWRMRTAARLLRETRDGLASIAGSVGYEEVAFSRAFKRWAGMPPGSYRRRALESQAG